MGWGGEGVMLGGEGVMLGGEGVMLVSEKRSLLITLMH